MRLKIVVPAVALLVFFLMSALYALGDGNAYWTLLRHWGIPEFPGRLAFGDMRGVLAAWQCDRMGIDTVESDPCDVLGRPFNYSPLWLLASRLPLTLAASMPAGWACGLVFLLALFLLPPPRTAREALYLALATISTMVVYAIERGNPDIVIFLLVLIVGFLALRSPPVRYVAYPVALFTGLLKYYPLTLMIIALRERRSIFLATALASAAITLGFVWIYLPELSRGLPLINNGSFFTDFFAAKNLPFGIAYLVAYGPAALADPTLVSNVRLYVALAGLLYVPVLLIFVSLCRRHLRLSGFRSALAELNDAESMFLLLGSALIVGCFFAGQNIGYRGIFFLLVLPGLLSAGRHGADRATRRVAVGTSIAILFIMWGECVRTNLLFTLKSWGVGDAVLMTAWLAVWLVRELAWWWSVSVMTAILVNFGLSAEFARWLTSMLRRRTTATLRNGAAPGGDQDGLMR